MKGDANYVAGVLKTIKGPVILVGHSYGGAVISSAATGNANVKALVYVAAFAPEKGETAIGSVGTVPGSTLGPRSRHRFRSRTATDLYIRQDRLHAQFAADPVDAVAAQMAATASRDRGSTQ